MIKTVDNEAGTAPISDLDRDEGYMMLALEQAALAEGLGEVPVGAVVVSDGIVIGRGHNRMIADQDPTAHAEIVALRQAAQVLKNYRVVPATLYVTLEPCAMCAGAMVHARLQTLVFGASEPRAGAVCSQQRFFESTYLNHQVVARGGILAAASSARLKAFFKAKRQGPPGT
ncbi:tRNA adenosine(34) deaminase TadA [Pseudomonadales bacterium]|nr:tRNA adenosine(34) deaminase TadA [Pseudomonadales bacterium]MDC0374709.1 tRNA adenosine(34) deaminase TadA [Pseudomonadales bacterium]